MTTVTALLVSHDGARWLSAVLDGLAEQTRPVDRLAAVDTGSSDSSVDLLSGRLGVDVVPLGEAGHPRRRLLSLPPRTPYGDAVAHALDAFPPDEGGDDWIWLLHDDSAPAPDTLETLLAAAADHPSADVLGPKLREWPSLRRLLEVGVTISGTGRRETGLERGEYDQGQHDRLHDVLAVNTAGMLVRRSVLTELGLDRRLPVFGNDLDFGWRAARAGYRTLVVPDAVVFHVEAAHRGVRRTELTGRHFRRGERQAALYTLLANCSAPILPWQVIRLLLGSLVRALAFLLVRAPGEAADEVAALARVYLRPDRILLARRRRRRSARVRPREVRGLLAPPWLPYRHGLDFLTDLATAVVHQATDMSAAHRARNLAERPETGPVPEEAESLPADSGWVARMLASPVSWVFVVLAAAAAWGARGLVGSGLLSGGALLPAPPGAGDWWRTYLASSHDIAVGSTLPAAPYLLPLALAGTLLLGKAWLVVDVVFLLAVPLAALGGHRFLRRITGSTRAALWGAVAYGLLPVLSGAVPEGRLGTVVASLVLPGLAHSALFLAPAHPADRRWRAAWRTALWLAVLAAFAPVTLPLAAVGVLLWLVVAGLSSRAGARPWGPVLVPVPAAALLLVPWSVLVWPDPGPTAWLFEAGLTVPGISDPVGWRDLLVGRPGAAGAPWWLTLGVTLAAVAALARPDTRRQVLVPWLVLLLGLAAAVGLAGVAVDPPGGGPAQPVWLGVPMLLVQAAAICAAALAATGVGGLLSGASFGWRQPVGLVVVAAALLAPVAGLAWWVLAESGGPLDRGPASPIPAYMTDAAAADARAGILVIRGSQAEGFRHLLVRGPGLRLGDDSTLPGPEAQRPLTRVVENLVVAPEPDDATALARLGARFVFAPAPADGVLTGNLDSLSGLTPGSAVRPGSRAWQVEPATEDVRAGPAPTATQRPWLLGLQGLAVLAVVVLAAPTRRAAR